MKKAKELIEKLNKLNEDEALKEGDLIITQKLVGYNNKFIGIVQGFDDFKNDEESFNNFKSDKIVLIKPLCTVDGDVVSDFNDIDKNGNIRMGDKSYRFNIIDKNKFEQYKQKAIERADRFKNIQIG